MPPEFKPEIDLGDEPSGARQQVVTVNAVVKTFGIAITSITALISLVWFAASLKGEIISLREDQVAMKHESELDKQQQEKRLDHIEERQDKTEASVADLNRKLDVAVSILERIDRKVNAP